MNVSRELALDTLKQVKRSIGTWIKDLDKPTELHPGGEERLVYPNGVPKGLSVSAVEGIPAEQMRAELLALAGMLEALATAQ